MTPELTLTLADPQASLAIAGGKGASLARLFQAGLPVPGGFHVTTPAYQQFVSENDLQPGILSALEHADPAQPATLEAASAAIQEAFSQARIPTAVATAITQAYSTLPGIDPVVAVRSSATAEDLPGLSFAGQQETYLNIQGSQAVLHSVQRCWASLWTARAIGYRLQHGIDQDTVSLAVVVQLLAPAEAAGILFTANPVTGQRDQVMITAAWGLGEAIVGGQVTPDTLTVDKTTLHVLARETGDKQVMTVRVEGGTLEQPVPEALRQASVLTDAQAIELARLGVRIEQLYGMPVDIEWALAGESFAILQARPVTALPEPQLPAPVEWPLPRPNSQCIRASIVELVPNPVSPLFATWGFSKINRSLKDLMKNVFSTSPDAIADETMVTINGYAYQDFGLTTLQWIKIMKMLLKFPYVIRNGIQRWQEIYRPQYQEVSARWGARRLQELSPSELVQGVDEIMVVFGEHLVCLMISTMGITAGSEVLFTKVYASAAQREGDPSAPTFLMGFDSLPILGEKALYDLALWCQEHENLAAFLARTPAQRLASLLDSDMLPEDLAVEEWGTWKNRFHEYLERYGYSIYDMDFAHPLPMDDPAPMLETLKLFITGQAKSPYERQAAFVERRQQAVASARSRLKGLKRWAFEQSLKFAQRQAPYREDGIAEIGLGYPQVRRMLFELGRRFSQVGVIAEAQDIFWLKESEVRETAAALQSNASPDDLQEQARQRKAQHRAYKQVTPPPQVPPKKKMIGMDVESMMAVGGANIEGNILKGIGASPGKVSAAAKVLHGSQDFDQMQPGDVLVASITTPAWTPLFALASAIVTDIGGPLSHSSIVAREYGIPAVLGTGVATRYIHSGQSITVDGSAGLVTLAD